MRKVVHNCFERDDNRIKANNYKTERQTTKKIHARYIKKFVHEIWVGEQSKNKFHYILEIETILDQMSNWKWKRNMFVQNMWKSVIYGEGTFQTSSDRYS